MQNNLVSNNKVIQYLLTHHNYLCLVESIASPAESEQQGSNRLLATDNATWNAFRTEASTGEVLIELQCSSSRFTSEMISAPCTSTSNIISEGTSYLMEAHSISK